MNMYLSSLQQGLQSGHLISELFVKYLRDDNNLRQADLYPNKAISKQHQMLLDWATHDKVMIVCNGGNCETIQNLYDFFKNTVNSLPYKMPFVKFCEDKSSLNNALTGCAIIIPEIYFEADSIFYKSEGGFNTLFTKPEIDFIEKIKSFSLAK